ncbi:hypothetical protein BDV98DRAFT_586512 [Pterulicium gracile]|uniref:MYND-type domain-containing protein n=1 Tax=Pterulicium gracile TaxID=1884261 RepID=A0A5C3Q2D0_9AGAR|nr:hypothetical protein BDV98DRAFT_586512 [Pterula gracilis]
MIFDSGALKDFIAIAMQTCGDNTVEKDTRRSFSANSFSLYNALLFLLSSHHTPQFHKLVAQLGYADINTWWEQSTSLTPAQKSNGVFAATQHHLPSKPYSKCGGCKVITYCLPECQKAAWSHGQFPHCNQCSFLSTLNNLQVRASHEWLSIPPEASNLHLILFPSSCFLKSKARIMAAAQPHSQMCMNTQHTVCVIATSILELYSRADKENGHGDAPAYHVKSFKHYQG